MAHGMAVPTMYVSFLVRLWCKKSPELPEGGTHWQGEVEHIQSGRRWTFSTLNELLTLLRRLAEDSEVLNRPAGQ